MDIVDAEPWKLTIERRGGEGYPVRIFSETFGISKVFKLIGQGFFCVIRATADAFAAIDAPFCHYAGFSVTDSNCADGTGRDAHRTALAGIFVEDY